MDKKLLRILVIEMVGVFGLVLFSSGLVCINHMTSPMPYLSAMVAPPVME